MTGRVLKALVVLLFLVYSGGCGKPFVPPPQGERTVEIGVLFRRQFSPDPHQDRMFRHVDMVLADDSIVGFYKPEVANDFIYTLIGAPGVVRRNDWMTGDEAHNADIEAAKAYRRGPEETLMPFVTRWVRVPVTQGQAESVAEAWDRMERARPTFRLINRNCVTRSADALVAAGILPRGVFGPDTPGNLLLELRRIYGSELTEAEGFYGYRNGEPAIEPLPPAPDQ